MIGFCEQCGCEIRVADDLGRVLETKIRRPWLVGCPGAGQKEIVETELLCRDCADAEDRLEIDQDRRTAGGER